MRKLKPFIGIIALIIIFILIGSGYTYAASGDEKLDLENLDEQEALNKNINIGALLLRYLISVIGVLLLTYIGVKFFVKKFEPPTAAGDWVQIIDQMPLGANRGLYLVEIEGKGYVLGVTEQQINIITTIEEEEKLDKLRGLTLTNLSKPKFKFNVFKRKKNTDFHDSLQEQIRYTQKLYRRQEGDRNHEK